jgi:hypothetical protein
MQEAAYKSSRTITGCGVTISAQKTKLMAFKGGDTIRSKIVIENKIIEQVNSFKYLRNLISYEREVDTDSKLNNYLKITGIINIMFRQQKKKKRTIQYNTLSSRYTIVKIGPLIQDTQEE